VSSEPLARLGPAPEQQALSTPAPQTAEDSADETAGVAVGEPGSRLAGSHWAQAGVCVGGGYTCGSGHGRGHRFGPDRF